MPFGIQTKGFLVGLALGAFVVPRVQAMVVARTK